MKWSEGIWSMTKCLKVEGSEKLGVKWAKILGGTCVLIMDFNFVVWMWVVICFMSFALCYVPINCFMFLNLYIVCCFFVVYVLLSILCVLCFCIILCTVSLHVYICLFSICVQFYWPLLPGGNSFPVNKYHIKYSNNNTMYAQM